MVLESVHRSGPLRQTNKAHKGGRKKNNQNDKGRTEVKLLTINKKHDLNRKDRRNRALQLRKNKRDEVLAKKRYVGGAQSPPVLVGIIPLNPSQDPSQLLEGMKACHEELVISDSKKGHCHISCPRLKQRFTVVCPNVGNMHDVLDIVKVADVLLLVHTLDDLDSYMEMLLSSILSHALPTTIHVAVGLDTLNPKKKSDAKKAILKTMESRFPDEKLHQADTKQDFLLLMRNIGSHKRRSVAFRDARPHLLAEDVVFLRDNDPEVNSGTLKVSGYVRGQPLNVNGLVHIPGWGDFQMSQIEYGTDPHPWTSQSKAKSGKTRGSEEDGMMLDETVVVDKADPTWQESLQSEIIPDPMQGEQTWPTEEELAQAKSSQKGSKALIRDSSDSDNEISSDSEDEDFEDMKLDNLDMSDDDQMEDSEVDDDQETVPDSEDTNKYDEKLDMDEERKTLVRFREERMEQMFPDEIDTPGDVAAKDRYQRYRGLKSFTHSTWDHMENLPPEYARIFHFENFKQMKKKIFKEEKEGALPGLYVTLHITNVPAPVYDSMESSPFVVYGLLPHEQKMSCVNVVVRKHPSCTEPIKSKDRLIFHLGFRRFVCQPLFSVHGVGKKHKFERYLPNNGAVVASFFAPVVFPPCSAVVFQQKSDGTHQLVATGSVFDVSPDRLIIKRIVLSGHPFKIQKKSAVVRYMFFNRDDILWFKCVELRTKYGRKGHIREPLGTHGHMKCVFDQQLKSQDVILMSLYKRVFPKWTYDPCVPTPCSPYDSLDISML